MTYVHYTVIGCHLPAHTLARERVAKVLIVAWQTEELRANVWLYPAEMLGPISRAASLDPEHSHPHLLSWLNTCKYVPPYTESRARKTFESRSKQRNKTLTSFGNTISRVKTLGYPLSPYGGRQVCGRAGLREVVGTREWGLSKRGKSKADLRGASGEAKTLSSPRQALALSWQVLALDVYMLADTKSSAVFASSRLGTPHHQGLESGHPPQMQPIELRVPSASPDSQESLPRLSARHGERKTVQ